MSHVLDYNSPIRRDHPRVGVVRLFILVGLLLIGVELWLISDFWLYRPMNRVLVYVAAIALCFVPPVQRALRFISDTLDVRSWPRTLLAFTSIVFASIGVLYATALSSDRQFTPVMHDEFAYLLQAQIYASGHLWLPAHPLADFFDTFYVIVDRAYVSQYFPGAPLMFLPAVWLGAPEWATPLVLAGMTCGMLFLLLRELFNSATAVSGVVVLIAVPSFRFLSLTAISQIPALLLLMVVLYAVLVWDRRRTLRWIVVAGAALGFLAVTRPLEAVVCGVSGGTFVLGRALATRDLTARLVLAGMLPLLPFLALQMSIDRGVTGRWLQTPFDYYLQRDMPGTELGFHTFDPAARPVSSLPQKQAFYDDQVAKAARAHTPMNVLKDWAGHRFSVVATELFPDMLLVIVVPATLLSLGDRRRWPVLAIMPLWWVLYSLHPFLYAHYYVFYAPSLLVFILAGFDGIASSLGPRGERVLRAAQVLLPITISVLAMPQFKKDVRDKWISNPVESALEADVARLPSNERAIVLVRFDKSALAEQEVVYNISAAWPDDARVIRAHDLGDDRDAELLRYYAARQPDRVVYRLDRKDLAFSRLGTVGELMLDAATRPATMK